MSLNIENAAHWMICSCLQRNKRAVSHLCQKVKLLSYVSKKPITSSRPASTLRIYSLAMLYLPTISHLNSTENTRPLCIEDIVNCSRWFHQHVTTTLVSKALAHLPAYAGEGQLQAGWERGPRSPAQRAVEACWVLSDGFRCGSNEPYRQVAKLSLSWRVILESLEWNMVERRGVLWWPKEVFWVHGKEKEPRAETKPVAVGARMSFDSRSGSFWVEQLLCALSPVPFTPRQLWQMYKLLFFSWIVMDQNMDWCQQKNAHVF